MTTAVQDAPAAPRSWLEWAGLALLAVAALDVIGLFLSGVFNWAPVLKFTLTTFIYLQMAMTGASLLSIPLTLILKARSGLSRKK